MIVGEASDAPAVERLRQVRSIQEFWLDFLLEEEFACDLRFAAHFAQACGEPGSVREVVDLRQEVDLGPAIVDVLAVLAVERLGQSAVLRVALLIEDKITAGPALRQAKRYREAGEKHTPVLWDEFKTVLVAPGSYVGEQRHFDGFIPLEQLKLWLCPDDPVRAAFRQLKIDEAIRKKNATGVKVPDSDMLAFKQWYFDQLCTFNAQHGTDFRMKPLRSSYYANDTWCEFTSDALPSFCQFRHKIRTDLKTATGKIEVAFKETDFASVAEPLRQLFDKPYREWRQRTARRHRSRCA